MWRTSLRAMVTAPRSLADSFGSSSAATFDTEYTDAPASDTTVNPGLVDAPEPAAAADAACGWSLGMTCCAKNSHASLCPCHQQPRHTLREASRLLSSEKNKA